MYEISKRAYFTTLGELRMLLAEYPDDTKVCTGGVLGSWLHVEIDETLVSFDDEDLGPDYYDFLVDTCTFIDEEATDLEESFKREQIEAHVQRRLQTDLNETEARCIICGNETFQTFSG